MLITYHSWKHNSCCNNISKPCHRHGANTVQLQSRCAKYGQQNATEVLFAHFEQQMGLSLLLEKPLGVPAPSSSRCWWSWAAEANLLSGTNTPTPSAVQGRNMFVQTDLLEVSESPSATYRHSIPAGSNSRQDVIHYSQQGNYAPTSQDLVRRPTRKKKLRDISNRGNILLQTANEWKVDETQRNREAAPDGRGCRERFWSWEQRSTERIQRSNPRMEGTHPQLWTCWGARCKNQHVLCVLCLNAISTGAIIRVINSVKVWSRPMYFTQLMC